MPVLWRVTASLIGPLGLASGGHGSQLSSDTLNGIVGVVMIEVGLGVLRVIDVAVVALAVVLPDSFSWRPTFKVHQFGDLGTRRPCGARGFGEGFVDRPEVRRFLRELMKIRPSTSRAWADRSPSWDLSRPSCIHATAAAAHPGHRSIDGKADESLNCACSASQIMEPRCLQTFVEGATSPSFP